MDPNSEVVDTDPELVGLDVELWDATANSPVVELVEPDGEVMDPNVEFVGIGLEPKTPGITDVELVEPDGELGTPNNPDVDLVGTKPGLSDRDSFCILQY